MMEAVRSVLIGIGVAIVASYGLRIDPASRQWWIFIIALNFCFAIARHGR